MQGEVAQAGLGAAALVGKAPALAECLMVPATLSGPDQEGQWEAPIALLVAQMEPVPINQGNAGKAATPPYQTTSLLDAYKRHLAFDISSHRRSARPAASSPSFIPTALVHTASASFSVIANALLSSVYFKNSA